MDGFSFSTLARRGILALTVALGLGFSSPAAQASEPLDLGSGGVARLELLPGETVQLQIVALEGSQLLLRAVGAGAAPSLSLAGPEGGPEVGPVLLELKGAGRLAYAPRVALTASGTHTLSVTDSGQGGPTLVVIRQRVPVVRTLLLQEGEGQVALISPGPTAPVSLIVSAPASLPGANGPRLESLTGPQGQLLTLPAGSVRELAGGRVLLVGPVILPDPGVYVAAIRGVPAPGAPLPTLTVRQQMRLQRTARIY